MHELNYVTGQIEQKNANTADNVLSLEQGNCVAARTALHDIPLGEWATQLKQSENKAKKGESLSPRLTSAEEKLEQAAESGDGEAVHKALHEIPISQWQEIFKSIDAETDNNPKPAGEPQGYFGAYPNSDGKMTVGAMWKNGNCMQMILRETVNQQTGENIGQVEAWSAAPSACQRNQIKALSRAEDSDSEHVTDIEDNLRSLMDLKEFPHFDSDTKLDAVHEQTKAHALDDLKTDAEYFMDLHQWQGDHIWHTLNRDLAADHIQVELQPEADDPFFITIHATKQICNNAQRSVFVEGSHRGSSTVHDEYNGLGKDRQCDPL